MEDNKGIVIYYFSATGNSLKLSLDIASQFKKSAIYRISADGKVEYSNASMVGFVFPVYMGSLPEIVRKFLWNFPFRRDVYYFSIGTYYTYKGCANSIVNRILISRGVHLSYGSYLPAVGNCLKEYEVSQIKRARILKRTEVYASAIISDLKCRVISKPPKYFRLLDVWHKGLFNLFFSEMHKRFTLENTCIRCKVCEKVCPVNNISIKNKKPQWGTQCEACHACVHWCPKNAINIGKSKGRLQYQNPAVKSVMLFR